MRDKLRYALLMLLLLGGITGLSVGLYELLRGAKLDLPSAFIQVAVWVLFGFLGLLILRYVGLLWFSYLNHLERDDGESTRMPPVTILVPAYNEGAVIQGSIRSLLELDYPRYEILVIDDGSTDDTYVQGGGLRGRVRSRGGARHHQAERRQGERAQHRHRAGAPASSSCAWTATRACTRTTLRRGDPPLRRSARRRGRRQREGREPRQRAGRGCRRSSTSRASTWRARAQGFFRVVNIIPGPIGVFRASVLRQGRRLRHTTPSPRTAISR